MSAYDDIPDTVPVSYSLLRVRFAGEHVSPTSGSGETVGRVMNGAARLWYEVTRGVAAGAPVQVPQVTSMEYGSSVDLEFRVDEAESTSGGAVEASADAARLVARMIESPNVSPSNLIGGDGVAAFEDLLQILVDERVDLLCWQVPGSDLVQLRGEDARSWLQRIRTSKFVAARGPEGTASRVALVLMAGGARGAYEAGVLSVLLPALEARGERPNVLVGAGAGAINAAILGGCAHLPADVAADTLVQVWRSLRSADVYGPVTPFTAAHALFSYLRQAFGFIPSQRASLIDPGALASTLPRIVDFAALHHNVNSGALVAVAILAFSTTSGRSVAFTDGPPAPPPNRAKAIDYINASLEPSQLMASFAMPVLFPAVEIVNPTAVGGWYSHGAMRLTAPLAPALSLGAERIVAIGTEPLLASKSEAEQTRRTRPGIADMLALVVGSVTSDRVAEDVQTTAWVNELVDHAAAADAGFGGRRVPYLLVTPPRRNEIGALASEVVSHRSGLGWARSSPDWASLSRLIRSTGPHYGQLMSSILFEPTLTDALLDLGRSDAIRHLSPGPDGIWTV